MHAMPFCEKDKREFKNYNQREPNGKQGNMYLPVEIQGLNPFA